MLEEYKLNCGHKFCTPCIKANLEFLITNSKLDKLTCPDHTCKFELVQEDLNTLLSEELMVKFLLYKERNQILKDSSKKYCP